MACGVNKSPSSLSAHQTRLHQELPASSGDTHAANNSSSTANSTAAKARMRWTPELHEAFVEAVSKLGGSERMSLSKLWISNIKKLPRVNCSFC